MYKINSIYRYCTQSWTWLCVNPAQIDPRRIAVVPSWRGKPVHHHHPGPSEPLGPGAPPRPHHGLHDHQPWLPPHGAALPSTLSPSPQGEEHGCESSRPWFESWHQLLAGWHWGTHWLLSRGFSFCKMGAMAPVPRIDHADSFIELMHIKYLAQCLEPSGCSMINLTILFSEAQEFPPCGHQGATRGHLPGSWG